MSTMKKWMSSLLVLAVTAVPVIAESNSAKTGSENAANETSAEATPAPSPSPNPNLTTTTNAANVTALLGVLVMKGVLAPSEANAIKNAAPEAEFQLLVDALNRKGVLSAADFSAAGKPAALPSSTAVPAALLVTEVASVVEATPAQRQDVAQNPPQKKPSAPNVVPAVVPLRVL